MLLELFVLAALHGQPQNANWWDAAPLVSEYDSFSDPVGIDQSRLKGWTYVAMNDGRTTAMLTRNAASGPNQIWVRYELSVRNPDGYLSARVLNEFDCRGRYRALQQETFALSDLTGGSERSGITDWEYVAPDTMVDALQRLVCNPHYQ